MADVKVSKGPKGGLKVDNEDLRRNPGEWFSIQVPRLPRTVFKFDEGLLDPRSVMYKRNTLHFRVAPEPPEDKDVYGIAIGFATGPEDLIPKVRVRVRD